MLSYALFFCTDTQLHAHMVARRFRGVPDPSEPSWSQDSEPSIRALGSHILYWHLPFLWQSCKSCITLPLPVPASHREGQRHWTSQLSSPAQQGQRKTTRLLRLALTPGSHQPQAVGRCLISGLSRDGLSPRLSQWSLLPWPC